MSTEIVTVTHYADHPSIDVDSWADHELGRRHNIFGSNNPNNQNLKPGDMSVVVAYSRVRKNWIVQLVRIEERLYICTLWEDNGGRSWKYNYRFTPLSNPFIVSKDNKNDEFIRLCKKYDLEWHACLNSRIHGFRNRFLPVLKHFTFN